MIDWNHVPTKENPADLISRGASPSEISENDLWWNGPLWLRTNDKYLQSPPTMNIETDLEAKCTANAHTCIKTERLSLVLKYSSLSKLFRIMARCNRFICNIRSKSRIQGELTAMEIHKAKLLVIKLVQLECFPDELIKLRQNEPVSRRSRLINLNPFIDDEGILRVGGRLKHSELPYSSKHPAILSSKHYFTKLVIRHEHERTLHAGVSATIAAIRQSFWILNTRNTVRNEIRNCLKCAKLRPKPANPIMGNLPANRIRVTPRPFISTGVDYCGPFTIKEGGRRSKRSIKIFVAIFVCLNTKAVHIEPVCDLTAESFIATLQRFIARRGSVAELFSDNGRNFVGANRELQKLAKIFNSEAKLGNFMAEEGIIWKFIPPGSPHFGRLWEATVKSFKHHFRRIASQANLAFEEFLTLANQIEAVLNSRPLCPLSADPNDQEALTPGHFLIGSALNTLQEPGLESLPDNKLSRWQHIQKMKQHFWSRWSKEYLMELQKRTKWKSSATPLTIGQLVLIREENLPPQQWKMGRIVDVHPGDDGVIRLASIKVATSSKEGTIIKRTAPKICVLPMSP